MLKLKISLLFNNLKFKVALLLFVVAAIVVGMFFIPKNKARQVSANDKLTSDVLIQEACTLLDKGYWTSGEAGAGHGVYGNIWEKKYDGKKVYCLSESEFKSFDCTGFIYYILTKKLDCTTSGFYYQNPVPVDPNHWYTDAKGKTVTQKSALTINYNGNSTAIKVLKAGENITENNRYYNTANGNLPVGSIVVSHGKKLGGHDHAWIYLGDLKTTDAKEVAKILVNKYGVSANLLIKDGGDINGAFEIKEYYNAKTGKQAPVINAINSTSTHWRIESTADASRYGVYINNGDPNQGEKVSIDGKTTKTVGPIYAFEIASQPKVIEGNYSIEIVKVKKDGSTVITESEATFKVNGTEQNTTKGILNVQTNKKIENDAQIDSYEIIETKAPQGYTPFTGTLKLNVKFKSTGEKYIIDAEKTTAEGFNDLTKFNISSDGTKITVYVVNEVEKTGNYSIELVKVKEDGKTVITNSEATFKINGQEQNTKNGLLNIVNAKNIADVNRTDSFEIIETKAPEGYTPFKGTLKLDVNFKIEGDKYVIDPNKTIATGFNDITRIEISPDNTKIKVYVVNTPLGSYNVELFKVDENGKIIEKEAGFKINNSSDIQKTVNGKLTITSGKLIEPGKTDVYSIEEVAAPENYRLFDGILYLDVQMKETKNGFELDKDEVSLTIKNGTSNATFELDGTTVKVYVENVKKDFDLSLRKFISKINGNELSVSREPIINKNSIDALEKTGTAEYYHEKESIGVKVGDEIEYTFRIYNEGEILGYAKQITDYLPEGLSFVKLSEDNSSNYTTTSEVGSRKIVIDYSGNTEIKSLRDFIGKEVKVNNEYYQEVKLICKVEDVDKIYLTNRAEITNYGYTELDKNGEEVWIEADKEDIDNDSVQDTIKDSLDLDNWYEENVLNNENNNNDNNNSDNKDDNKNEEENNKQNAQVYYPGVEDDDDFETVELLKGTYNIIIKKVDSTDKTKTLSGAYFKVTGSNISETEVGPTLKNGEVTLLKSVKILAENQKDKYTIVETKAPSNYKLYNEKITLNVATTFNGKTFVIDEKNTTVDGKNIEYSVNSAKTTITIIVPNVKKEFDLSLRKFITEVNNVELQESRVPQVDTSKLISGESTTATYEHSKVPVDVNTTDIVTYTIRVYNEGEMDGYASKIMDDIPEGLEFVPATYDANGNATNTNAIYKWTIYREVAEGEKVAENTIEYNGKKYVVTGKVEDADLIVTDYLSKENSQDNLIKAYNHQTMKTLDYKDVKVSFKVIEPTTSDRILTNYAQITDDEDSDGNPVVDIDSTPNKWVDGEDDQDTEKVKVRYFDLSLLKWVTKAIVYENGNKTIIETGHTGYEKPEPIVKVDLKNTSLNTVEVKFEYTIRITNEGEIAGYAKEISDYIPQGLKFVASDNPEWKEVDGKIVTRALESTLLQPKEYVDVTVILTWINSEDNLGVKTNIAEISEDYNDYGTPDIDSTPNNKVEGEDDIDEAPVMLAIRTGEAKTYVALAISVLTILTVGTIIIKKKVLL